MCRDDHVKPASGMLLIQINAVETEIGQPKILGPLPRERDGRRRSIETDHHCTRALFRIEGRQKADATTDVEDRIGTFKPARDPRTDLQVIFIPLTVEGWDGLGSGRQIVKCDFRGGSVGGHAFRFDGPVQCVEFLWCEDFSLPRKIGGIGFDVPKSPPGQVLVKRRSDRVIRVARHRILFPKNASRFTPYGRFSIMASS